MSKQLLLALYYCILTPTGWVLRQFGYDPMDLKKWKQGRDSAFHDRTHTYGPRDLNAPR